MQLTINVVNITINVISIIITALPLHLPPPQIPRLHIPHHLPLKIIQRTPPRTLLDHGQLELQLLLGVVLPVVLIDHQMAIGLFFLVGGGELLVGEGVVAGHALVLLDETDTLFLFVVGVVVGGVGLLLCGMPVWLFGL